MPLKLFVALLTLILCLHPQNAHAQQLDEQFHLNPDASFEPPVRPELLSTSILVDNDEIVPVEPNIGEVKFLKYPPVNSIEERVDRLVQGVKQSIPPEYDHYGYEIRRYMAYVGNLKIYEDDDFLIEQIKNVRKAKIIAEYWEKALNQEIKELEEILSQDDASLSARTVLRQNKATLRTFIVVLKSWIEANERLLMFNFDNPRTFVVEYPEIIISDAKSRIAFYNLMAFKQVKLEELQRFGPWEIMVH